MGTALKMSSTFHPQTNGLPVHTNQVMEDMLRVCAIDFESSWETHLLFVEYQDGTIRGTIQTIRSISVMLSRGWRQGIVGTRYRYGNQRDDDNYNKENASSTNKSRELG